MTVFQVPRLWEQVLNTFPSMANQPGFLLAPAIGPQQSSAWPMTWRPRAYTFVAKATALICTRNSASANTLVFLILENKSRFDLLHTHFLWHHNDTAVTLHCCSQGQANSWKQAKTRRAYSEEQQRTKPTMLALACPGFNQIFTRGLSTVSLEGWQRERFWLLERSGFTDAASSLRITTNRKFSQAWENLTCVNC